MVLLLLGVSRVACADDALAAVERMARVELRQWAETRGFSDADIQAKAQLPAGVQAWCADAWAVSSSDAQIAARKRYVAECPVDGRKFAVMLHASVDALAWQASRALAAGHPLEKGDLKAVRMNVLPWSDALPAQASTPDGTLGMKLRAGQVLQQRHLGDAESVQRGQAVQLVSGGESFRVSVAATAMDAGGPGKVIRVRNSASGRWLKAKVVGAGVVEAIAGTP